MLVVMQDKIMNVSSRYYKIYFSVEISGFEDVDYYPEKNPDQRLRRERVPVGYLFLKKLFGNLV